MRKLLIAFTLVTIWGCAPPTALLLKQDHAGKRTFDVEMNYQPVYRLIVTQARKCYQTGMITAQLVVQSDLFTDIQEGNVTVALHGGFGVDTHMTIDIKALSEARTRVDTYYALTTWAPAALVVEEWVVDKSTECGSKRPALGS